MILLKIIITIALVVCCAGVIHAAFGVYKAVRRSENGR
jgi:hypothetical protein